MAKDSNKRTDKEIEAIRERQSLDQSYAFISYDCPKHWRKLYIGLRKAKFDREQSLRLLQTYITCMLQGLHDE